MLISYVNTLYSINYGSTCSHNYHMYIFIIYTCTVSGEANFAMKHTGLTIGGFTQPSVARNLIDNQSNVEKGLCQRFLWILPRPTTVSFEKLEQVDKDFFTAIGT